jgi:hypothetical protein
MAVMAYRMGSLKSSSRLLILAQGAKGGGDMLLQALVACAGVTLRSVATSLDIPLSGRVAAGGDLDFRGTLGVAPSCHRASQ